ncbi:uncharacterized protein EDB93DRAFT_1178556, partial [Suillus bovinus]|uniref:uncharacterized protein n=1 Tax=Suillus bovinus TaxID=48563 RepID=UPI001B86A8D9
MNFEYNSCSENLREVVVAYMHLLLLKKPVVYWKFLSSSRYIMPRKEIRVQVKMTRCISINIALGISVHIGVGRPALRSSRL